MLSDKQEQLKFYTVDISDYNTCSNNGNRLMVIKRLQYSNTKHTVLHRDSICSLLSLVPKSYQKQMSESHFNVNQIPERLIFSLCYRKFCCHAYSESVQQIFQTPWQHYYCTNPSSGVKLDAVMIITASMSRTSDMKASGPHSLDVSFDLI